MGKVWWRWRASIPACRRYDIDRLHAYLIIHNQQIFGSYFPIVTKNCGRFTFIEVVSQTILLTHLWDEPVAVFTF